MPLCFFTVILVWARAIKGQERSHARQGHQYMPVHVVG